MDNKLTVANEVLAWETEEFQRHSKTAVWYIGFTVIAAGLLIFAFFAGGIMTIITFALIILLGFIYSHRNPRLVLHQLTPTGIVLGDVMYPYKNIKNFWILYEPPMVKTLNIQTTAMLNSHVSIQLGDQDPTQAKMYLKKYLLEDLDREESLVDVIVRRFRI